LYFITESLLELPGEEILFSVPVSSSCREATFWFALSSGYLSTTAKSSSASRSGSLPPSPGPRAPSPTGLLARLDDLGERSCSYRHVILHDLHQVRNEVVPALQLHVDLVPAFLIWFRKRTSLL